MRRRRRKYAREVFGYIYAPGKVFAEIVALAREFTSALLKILLILNKYGIRIEEVSSGAPLKNLRPVFIIADITDIEELFEKAVKEISYSPEVNEIFYFISRADPEVRFSQAFPLVYYGTMRRAVLFDAEHFCISMAAIKKEWGDEGKALLFLLGKTWGLTLAQLDKRKGIVCRGEEGVLSRFSDVWLFTGRGQVKRTYGRLIEYIIEIEDNFEAMCIKAEEPSCHWTRGYITGYLEGHLGFRYNVLERKCLSAGDSVCVFSVRKFK